MSHFVKKITQNLQLDNNKLKW